MIVKIIKPIKLKTKDGTKFYRKNEVLSFDGKMANFLREKGYCEVFHENIKEQCFQPFQCELIEEDGSCLFIKKDLLSACMGPYRVTPDGGMETYKEIRRYDEKNKRFY